MAAYLSPEELEFFQATPEVEDKTFSPCHKEPTAYRHSRRLNVGGHWICVVLKNQYTGHLGFSTSVDCYFFSGGMRDHIIAIEFVQLSLGKTPLLDVSSQLGDVEAEIPFAALPISKHKSQTSSQGTPPALLNPFANVSSSQFLVQCFVHALGAGIYLSHPPYFSLTQIDWATPYRPVSGVVDCHPAGRV